jgi:hypothetical protein
MPDSEITWFIAITAIIALISFVCTAYAQSDSGFNIPDQWRPHNYTVEHSFTNMSAADVHKIDVWGKWSMDSANGLYPNDYINRAWIPFTSDNWARVQFGNVRLINNTFTEKYYLNNINRASGDMVKILITYQGTAITTGSTETYLVIDGSKVYIEVDTLELGYALPGLTKIYDKGYHLPAGVTSGNISYRAEFANGGMTDPMTGELSSNVNNFINVYVYWENQQVLAFDYTEILQAAASNLQRQADIQTNIGGNSQAYTLQILSHYESVGVVQISTENGADLTGIDSALGWVTTWLGVMTWGIPINVGIPPIILFCIIGIPEAAFTYIAARLIRGGG